MNLAFKCDLVYLRWLEKIIATSIFLCVNNCDHLTGTQDYNVIVLTIDVVRLELTSYMLLSGVMYLKSKKDFNQENYSTG